jgi:Cell wall-active antibiotics response 4TMS YvqF
MNSTPATSTELPGLVVTPMGGLRRSGPLALRARTTLVTLIGGLDLDLTGADVPAGGAQITKVSVVGGVSVVVPPDVRVEVSGFSLIGGRDVERVREVPADAPVIRLRSFGLVGGVRVRVGTA